MLLQLLSKTHTISFYATQFEPESFVDGLLGIGVAGGGSSKEGKALEARLTQMRNERTQRAKTAPKPSSTPEASSMGGGSAGQMTLQGLENIGSMDMEEGVGEMQMITPGAGGGAGKNKAKNKNKKKKKRKNKK